MLPPASSRPLSRLIEKHKDGSLGWDLVVNIKSRGQWVAFAGHKTLAKSMLYPGMFDFSGDPSTWDIWGKHVTEPYHAERVWMADRCPVLAPLGSYGVMVVDYDDRRVLSMQGYGAALEYSTLSADEEKPESLLMQGLGEHLLAGNIPMAGLLGGGMVALPPRPASTDNPLSWVIRAVAEIHKTTPERIREDECLELPLSIPGWTLKQMPPGSPEAAAWLADNGHLLHSGELEAWEAWATVHEYEPLAASARSALLGLKLDADLYGCQRPGFPAVPRL